MTVTADHSAFILKLSGRDYPELAANEHLSLHLAHLAGLEVPAFSLVRLGDGELALIVRRFDREDDGGRIAMEDFCQLNGLLAAEKYDGSAELCARTVRRFADEPGPDLLRLFRTFLFSWWRGEESSSRCLPFPVSGGFRRIGSPPRWRRSPNWESRPCCSSGYRPKKTPRAQAPSTVRALCSKQSAPSDATIPRSSS